jgi:hypothetical protein
VAILTTMKIKGDPDELLRQKKEKIDPIAQEIARANGGIEHLVAKTEDGLLIVNLWENVEGMEKTAAEIGKKAQEEGMAAPTDWHQYELVQRETP